MKYIILIIGVIIAFIAIKLLPNSLIPHSSTPNSLTSPHIEQAKNTQENIPSDAEQQKKLEKYLTVEIALLGVSDNISLYFKDLDHGKQFSVEPTKSWIPASTIKTYVVLEAFRQRDLGLISFDSEITINADNVVPTELEADEFPRLREGTKATIKQLVEAMIIQSDNTAYNTLLDILDRRNINSALKNIGLTETVVGEKLNLDDSQFQADLKVAGRQQNTTTAKDLATFFDLLYNKKFANSDEMISIFKRQKINNMIPALLPPSVEVAHKTGDWVSIYHDGGVVFKPNDPFILTIFTNTGDPTIVAKLAKVAYFQTPDSVGQTVSLKNQPQINNVTVSIFQKIELADQSSSNVLAESSEIEKFPAVTASDLGIKQQDLSISPKEVQDLRPALITSGALLYNLKTFIRDKQLQLTIGDTGKAKVYIDISKDKLSEVKTFLERGDVGAIQQLLDESEQSLAKAIELSGSSPDKDSLLVQIKQVNDLHFAVLNEKMQKLPSRDKEKFIDTVYNFYQKNKQEITPVVNSSVVANVAQQKPAIGTVTEVKNNTVTLQFDDGTKKDVILNDGTKVRAFQQDTYQSPDSITKGDKVAVLGIINKDSKIIPAFILKNIPKELPSKHTGTVIEIIPDQNTIKILDKKGQEEIIQVLSSTVLQSKDTNVSLAGIKAGSQITVFGVVTNANQVTPSFSASGLSPVSSTIPVVSSIPASSAKPLINPSNLPSPGSSAAPKIPQGSALPTKPAPVTSPQTSSKQPVVEVKASSVTVTKNSSGKNEVTINKGSSAPAPVTHPAPVSGNKPNSKR